MNHLLIGILISSNSFTVLLLLFILKLTVSYRYLTELKLPEKFGFTVETMNTKLDDIVDGDSEVFGMLIVRLKSRIFLKGKNTTVTCKDFKYHSSF